MCPTVQTSLLTTLAVFADYFFERGIGFGSPVYEDHRNACFYYVICTVQIRLVIGSWVSHFRLVGVAPHIRYAPASQFICQGIGALRRVRRTVDRCKNDYRVSGGTVGHGDRNKSVRTLRRDVDALASAPPPMDRQRDSSDKGQQLECSHKSPSCRVAQRTCRSPCGLT